MTEYGPPTTEVTIRNLRDAINSHDPNRVAHSFTIDYRCEFPMHPSRNFIGNEHVRANWTAMFERVPTIHATILRSVSDPGSGQTWSEWEMLGATRDGAPAAFRGVVISAARDGKIAWTRFYLEPVADDR